MAGYEYETSTDGGSSWSSANVGLLAHGLRPRVRRWCGSVPSTMPATPPAWVPATAGATNTVKLDRTGADPRPSVTGNNLSWLTSNSVTVTPSRLDRHRLRGFNHYEVRTSTNGGTTWSATATATSKAITAQGETLVQFRAVDNLGQRVRLDAGDGASRPHDADRADRQRRLARPGRTLPRVTVSGTGGSDSGGSLLAGYQYRTQRRLQLVGRPPRARAWWSPHRAPPTCSLYC